MKLVFLNRLFVYIIFIFIGLNIKLFSGLYIYNFLIFIYLFINYNKLTFNKELLNITIFIVIANLIPIMIQTILLGVEFSVSSIYILLNYALFLSFILFIKLIDFSKLNYYLIVSYIFLPIILSILMFLNSSIENFFLNFYHIEKYPAFGRYGGVFGKDVNALGIYASLAFLFTMILKRLQLINIRFSILLIFISLLAVLLSGMRTGVLVFFSGILLFHNKLKIINYKYLFLFIVSSIFLVTFIYLFNDTARELIDFLLKRFSPSYLVQSAGIGNTDHSNLQTAIAYFHRTIGDREITIYNILFGIDSKMMFVDNFYIFSFIKYGALFVLTLILFGIYLMIKSIIKKDIIISFFILVTFIIAIKGIFIINNVYMFLVVFIIYLWRNYENTYSRR